MGSIPESGRYPGGGQTTQSSLLAWRIPMDRGAWQAMVHRLAKEPDETANKQQQSTLSTIISIVRLFVLYVNIMKY